LEDLQMIESAIGVLFCLFLLAGTVCLTAMAYVIWRDL
jgi:hypothetical protein